jgi:hypothetical protein
MPTPQPPSNPAALGRGVREQLVADLEGVLQPMVEAIRARLLDLLNSSPSTKEMYARRDAMQDFERLRAAWAAATQKAWRNAVVPPTATARIRLEATNFELIGDEVVEMKILSSRLAMAIAEKASWQLNDLRLRIQHLENTDDLATEDILRPEAVSQLLVEQWSACGLKRESWLLVQDVIQQRMVDRLLGAYQKVNDFLIKSDVLPDVTLSARVKRSTAPARPDGRTSGGGGFGTTGAAGGATGPGSTSGGGYGGGSSPESSGRGGSGSGYGGAGGGSGQTGDSIHTGSPGAGGAGSGTAASGVRQGQGPAGGSAATGGGQNDGGGATNVADETRLMTSSTPLARARNRANGVIGQLKRLLIERVAGFNPEHVTRPSPALADAISQETAHAQTQAYATAHGGGATVGETIVYDSAAVEKVAGDLRQRSGELKRKATTSTEKATIEIVALMFQSILAEERIPPAVRVWFARLQMPVLRVAIAEPEFFGTLQHPARQLIDRMGSCVMGFDASSIGAAALEVEIKRVVQVIEQYPETGRRVFQLVYDEFQKFLSMFLTQKDQTQRLVSVAQQVEQKETMTIQYTIEMRNMLNDMPVRDEIREFLFKVWAEVLAVAAVKNGPQHEETIILKKCAAELVWAASAKPNRNDRARVIQDLPKLLQRLRQGMTLMGVQGAAQETHIKVIGDTLADAFLSKTEAIPQARIEAMAKRLANLEDFVADDPATDLPLDAESIELMLGIDASMIEVVADGGSKPGDAMLAWAQELQLGNWFTLDHNSKASHVQYVWRSDRKQLHLFATPEGKSFLIQARRLAAYLQAGLLLPTEEEALTVRATRDALAKLDANPERLLG